MSATARSFGSTAARFEAKLIDPRDRQQSRRQAATISVRAPMPGAIVSVHKAAGDQVTRGETLVTIESMKLQMALPAPRDGVIADVLRGAGETFDKDEIVARLEASRGES